MDTTFEFPVLPTLAEFKAEMAEAKDDKAKKAVLAKYAAIGQAFKDAYPEGCFFRATVDDLSVSSDQAKAKICHLILGKMPQDLRNLLGGVALRHSSAMVSRMCGHVSVQTLASYASLYDGLGTTKVQVEFVNAGDKYSNGDEQGVYEKPNFLVTPVKIFMSDRVLAKVEGIVEKRAVSENQNPASAQVRRTAGDIEA